MVHGGIIASNHSRVRDGPAVLFSATVWFLTAVMIFLPIQRSSFHDENDVCLLTTFRTLAVAASRLAVACRVYVDPTVVIYDGYACCCSQGLC